LTYCTLVGYINNINYNSQLKRIGKGAKMYRKMREMARKKALTNLDIKLLVDDGLWSFKQGVLSLTGTAAYLLEVIKWVKGNQLIGVVK
jgi:hypothetical protein